MYIHMYKFLNLRLPTRLLSCAKVLGNCTELQVHVYATLHTAGMLHILVLYHQCGAHSDE